MQVSALGNDGRTPKLASLRVPEEQSLPALASNARLLWRLSNLKEEGPTMDSSSPFEEYKSIAEFMRLYATLRFYQLALLFGTTGSIVTALSLAAVRVGFAGVGLLKAGGLVITLAFTVMEFRSSSYWHTLRKRANELARVLRFAEFPAASRWNPLTTSGAGFYLHVFVAMLWMASLFLLPRLNSAQIS